jgi:hypothetical protein
MDDSDNNNDHHHHHHQLQEEEEEEEEEEYDIIVDKLIPILQRKDEFSMRTRNRINELSLEFLEILEEDIHDMLCDNGFGDDYYRGLDSDRDTEAEVETAIRFFPDVLSRRSRPEIEGDEIYYPIQCQVLIRDERNLRKFHS